MKFFMRQTVRNIARHRKKSILHILPFDYMREAYHSQGIGFFADSGFFVVKDPFQLNALKARMHDEVKFLPVVTRAEFRFDGNALTIMDESFIRSAETLSKNLALLRGMFPFLVVIVIFIGYLCSYLSLQSRRGGGIRAHAVAHFFQNQPELLWK